jgi:cardiolipin synthase
MKINRKELFSIPNCMGYFRIFLIPVFCVIYLKADSVTDYYKAAAVILISAITDFLDGKIARNFNMITEFGKFIDPLADKLTHGAIALCLMQRYRNMKYLVLVMALKEGFMVIMGVINLRHGKKLDGAKMFGKLCTTSLFLVLLLLVFVPKIPEVAANSMILIEIIVMLITWGLYVPVFYRMGKENNTGLNQTEKRG